MLTDEEATRLVGATLVSADGRELGEIETVLTHAADNRAAWAAATVQDRRVVVPLDGARTEDDRLLVRYQAEQITSAPGHEGDQMNADSAEALYDHYGIDDSVLRDDSGFATEQGREEHGTSRDPRGGGGADDASQGHP
jgi:PRC-barrel domain